jgi:BlaI family transcriptional regulator, penicillinase repressor
MRKRGTPREIPPPLELECLKALWRLGEGSVKDVRQILTENRNLAYTTVMTVLERLARRGRVARRKVGRAFVYVPAVERQEMRRLAVKDLVETHFGGSYEALIDYLRPRPIANGPVEEDLRGESLDPTLL